MMTDKNKYKHFVGDRTPTMSVDLNLDRTDDFVNQSGTSDILDLLDMYGGEVASIETTDADGNSVIITGRQNNDGDGSNTQADLITQLQRQALPIIPQTPSNSNKNFSKKLQRKQRRQQGASSFLTGLQQGLGLLGGGQQQPQQQQQTATADTASVGIPNDRGNDWQKYVLFGLLWNRSNRFDNEYEQERGRTRSRCSPKPINREIN